MNTLKEQLTRWIDEDREQIIGFLSDFVRAKSPNPPGDTTLAAAHVASSGSASACPSAWSLPSPPCRTSGLLCGADARPHLVLNGHMDVFPSTSSTSTGRMARGAGRSRTARSTAAGWLTAALRVGLHLTYYYLYRVRDHLKGR